LVRRKRVKEALRPFFTELPDHFYEPEWRNIEMRVMRAMLEGYYVHMGLCIGDPAKKRYAVPFPMEPSVATIGDGVLGKNSMAKEAGPVCLFENLLTRRDTELVLVTSLPRVIWQSSTVKGHFVDGLKAALPSKLAEQLTTGRAKMVTQKAGVEAEKRRKRSRKKKKNKKKSKRSRRPIHKTTRSRQTR
jgi:hypothetical protein